MSEGFIISLWVFTSMRCTNQYLFFNLWPKFCYQHSRAKSNPVGLISTAATTLLTYNGHLRNAYPPAESSQVKSSPTTVDDSKSLEATCPIYISWTQVIVRDSCNSESRTACGTVDSLIKGHQTIYNASGCEHINRDRCLGKKHTAHRHK